MLGKGSFVFPVGRNCYKRSSSNNSVKKCFTSGVCTFCTTAPSQINVKYQRKLSGFTFIRGMPRGAVAFLWVLFLTSVLGAVSARSLPGSIEESSDIYRLIDNLQERDPKTLTYMKELALLLDKIKQQSLESSQQSEELLPIPMPMQSRLIGSIQDGPREDKRGSYMSLCHFKICNMGRKRGYWTPWNRP